MKRLQLSDFAELQRAFSGYLHEDFLDEYGSPGAALRAFHRDADHSERLRFWTEARRFVEQTARLDFTEVRALLAGLGCRWTPPSRRALVALLTETAPPQPDGHET